MLTCGTCHTRTAALMQASRRARWMCCLSTMTRPGPHAQRSVRAFTVCWPKLTGAHPAFLGSCSWELCIALHCSFYFCAMAEFRVRMPSTCPALPRLLTDRPSCGATFSFRSASLLVFDDAHRNGAEAKQPDEYLLIQIRPLLGSAYSPLLERQRKG